MFARTMLVVGLAFLAFPTLASAQDSSGGYLDMSDGYLSSHPVVVVKSIADGEPLEGVAVTVQSASGPYAATSDAFGYAVFPSLTITPDPVWSAGNVPNQERVVVSISDPFYVPVRAERMLAEGTMSMGMGLTPRSVGGTTSWVTAAAGGTFQIPGLGTLTVPPGVLLQDAFLHVTAVPAYGQSSGQFQEEELVHQVWLGAMDRVGNWVTAIPKNYAGITLTTTPTILPFEQGAVLSEHWVSRFIDDNFVETGQQPMATPRGRRAGIPVVDGSNLVTRTWVANPLSPGARGGADGQSTPLENECASSSWIVTEEVGSRIIEVSGTPMLCGHYLTDASAEVVTGQEFIGSSTLSVGAMSEVGASLKSVVAKVASKVGSSIRVDTKAGTTTSTSVKGAVGVHQNEILIGGDCFNAEVVNGVVMKTFKIYHVSREVCPDGSIERTTTNLGELEVAVGTKTWWKNLSFDGSCPGCAGTNPIPPKVPGTPMF